ncbi:MAG: phosphoribosylformylglycinamidine cyclo-ligase [Phycisphaerales bacterium]|jgi:phosphoribosylformylglycinamidine cyclo-ligase|nr:phosphoribosylformylglycinamidine cyclo-ligase [Phycisphaerales bacterium]
MPAAASGSTNQAGMTYAASGVDIEAGDRLVDLIKPAVRRTHGQRVMGQHGAFAGMFRLDFNEQIFQRNYTDPVLVACTDGVGTKVKLAADLGILDTVGIDCVAMNVNDLIVQGAEPLFFLDYLGLHNQDPETTAQIVEGVARGCEIAGCALIGGECAEMPDIYAEGDFDIAGFAVGVVELHRAVDPVRARAGDILIGLASSGVHSNGYSLVRRIVDKRSLRLDRAYAALGDTPLGKILLEPTRIYAQPIVKLLRRYRVKRVVSAMAHITGGGLEGNLPRVLPDNLDAVIDTRTWEIPPIFTFLQSRGDVDTDEMYRVFNMGIGYVLAVRPSFADSVLRQLQRSGETARIIGKLAKGTGDVQLKGRS